MGATPSISSHSEFTDTSSHLEKADSAEHVKEGRKLCPNMGGKTAMAAAAGAIVLGGLAVGIAVAFPPVAPLSLLAFGIPAIACAVGAGWLTIGWKRGGPAFMAQQPPPGAYTGSPDDRRRDQLNGIGHPSHFEPHDPSSMMPPPQVNFTS